MYTYTYTYMCLYVYIYMCVYVYIYIHIYIRTRVYVYYILCFKTYTCIFDSILTVYYFLYIHMFFMLAWMLVNAWPAAFVARRHRGPSQRARASHGP